MISSENSPHLLSIYPRPCHFQAKMAGALFLCAMDGVIFDIIYKKKLSQFRVQFRVQWCLKMLFLATKCCDMPQYKKCREASKKGTSAYFRQSPKNGEGGIRTHAPFRTNGFQDRLVMTTSIPLLVGMDYAFVRISQARSSRLLHHASSSPKSFAFRGPH